MKNLYAFVIIAFMALFQTPLQAQKTTDFKQPMLLNTNNSKEKIAEISKNFKQYALFSLDTRSLYTYLNEGNGNLDVKLGNETVSISYVRNTVVSDDYHVYGINQNGQYEVKSTLKTYDGRLASSLNSLAAITASENFFSMMFQKGNEYYYIESADMMSASAKGMYVMYKNTDYIGDQKFSCAHQDTEKAEKEIAATTDSRGVGPCLRIEWAIASDLSMYQKYSNSIPNVEARTVSVYNQAQVNYKNAFTNDYEFKILKQVVETSAGAIPVSGATDIQVVLTSFNTWAMAGNLNFNGGLPDMASFWSNRDYDGAAVGLAYLKAVCGAARTQVIQDFTTNMDEMRCTVAHETGHNFDASHDPAGSSTIMAPVVSAATSWSAASISAMNAFAASQGNSCLTSCSVPNTAPTTNFTYSSSAVCAGSQIVFIDDSTNDPTSWSWTLPGGTPAASTLEDVTVTYSTAGLYNVTHTSTNAFGTGTITKSNIIRVDNVTPASCSAPGTSTSPGGIKLFKLANLNSVSQSAAVEGKYKDFSCSRIATLEPDKDYEIVIEIGDCNTSLTENFKIWIDYNNNGILEQGTEYVSFSASSFCGMVTSTTGGVNGTTAKLKIRTPITPVFDKFLRCRIMTNTVQVQPNGCYSNLANIGQVEDYSVVFPSPFSANPTVKSVSCFGGNDGEANLNVVGGTAPLTYTWDNANVTGSNPKNLIAGTYNVTIGEAGVTKLTKSVTITQPTAALTVTTVPTAASCGQANGSIVATPAGGNSGYKYKWSNNGKDSSYIGGLVGGAYLLTLTDAKGCSTTVTTTVAATNAVNVVFSGNTTLCPGVSTKISVTGGITYIWNNGATTSDITVTPTGTKTYIVTATAGGCSKVDSIKVTVVPTTASITAPKLSICEGDSVALVAAGGGTYAWSNNIKVANNKVAPLKNTSYTVTVTNNGCTATATKDITVNVVTGTVTSSKLKPCAGESIDVTATGGGTYYWEGGNTTNKITTSLVGPKTFFVTITNTAGCSKKFSLLVDGVPQLPKPSIVIQGSATFCENGGSATLSAQPPNAPKYVWTNSTLTTQSINVTKSGFYTVKIVNGLCESPVSDSTKITALAAPPIPTITKTGSGSTLVSSSTTGNLWLLNNIVIAGSTTPTWKAVKTGNYIVQVTDPVTGCSSKSVAVNINVTGLIDVLDEGKLKVYPNPMEEVLNIALYEVPDAGAIVFTNVVGQVIMTKPITDTTQFWAINIENWAKGTYFVNILNKKGEKMGTRKVVKI